MQNESGGQQYRTVVYRVIQNYCFAAAVTARKSVLSALLLGALLVLGGCEVAHVIAGAAQAIDDAGDAAAEAALAEMCIEDFSPICPGYCDANPAEFLCPGYCDANPAGLGCPGYCTANPARIGCPGFCPANPDDVRCSSTTSLGNEIHTRPVAGIVDVVTNARHKFRASPNTWRYFNENETEVYHVDQV